MMSATMKIDSFQGEYRYLSNFYLCQIKYEGLTYASIEHAYQAAKSTDEEIRLAFTQLRNPATAKKMGYLVPLRAGWDDMKIDVMRTLVAYKFSELTTYGTWLMKTDPAELVEGNWHGDTFWGVDNRSGIGENWHGRILMERRAQLWGALTTT